MLLIIGMAPKMPKNNAHCPLFAKLEKANQNHDHCNQRKYGTYCIHECSVCYIRHIGYPGVNAASLATLPTNDINASIATNAKTIKVIIRAIIGIGFIAKESKRHCQ